ncbi:MAG: amidohydrolase [Myxococcota bacterium]|nr:amidohydrolase [Myxococcota bacterium]
MLAPSLLVFLSCATTPNPDGAPPADSWSLATHESSGRQAVERPPKRNPEPVVIHNATVLTASGDRLESGYVVLSEGRIQSVGTGAPPSVEGAVTLDAQEGFVTPGLIDTHSHLGVYPSPSARAHSDGNEATSPTTPGVWAEHSFWPQDPGIQRAVAGGVTSMQVLPGSANLVGGRGVVLHLLPTRGSRAMRFPGAPETVKMACGENPKRVYGSRSSAPSTRMGNLRGQRAAFASAKRLLEDWERYEQEAARHRGDDPGPQAPNRDLDQETLIGVLRGEILPQVHCYRADDMLSFLQLADEFGFSIRSFHHALEAYKIRDILAEKEVSVSTWADWWGFKLEAYDGIPHNAALVAESGARAIIHSDSAIGIQRLNQEAAKAYYSGLHAGLKVDENEALRWITANPAWALGIESEVGTIEAGKRGDVVVWDGHPFSHYSSASVVFIDGVRVHDAATSTTPWSDFTTGQEVAP